MKLSDIRKFTQNFPDPSSRADARLNEYFRQLGINPSDFYQELEMESRFVDTHQDVTYSNSTVQLHSHAFYELLYCRSTVGVEYLVGAERYKLQKGDIVFVAPGISHRPILPEQMPEAYVRDVLWISDDFFRFATANIAVQAPEEISHSTLFRTTGTRWEYIGDYFRQGVQESEEREIGWEMAVVANTLKLLTHLSRASKDISANSLKAEKPELLDQVLAYVEEHLSEKISMADVANHFFISEITITQAFRKKMGVSFYRCVTQRRLIAAKGLIQQGLPLESVAEQVGFTDYSSFFRAFKQEYGISPRQYRKIHSTPDNRM